MKEGRLGMGQIEISAEPEARSTAPFSLVPNRSWLDGKPRGATGFDIPPCPRQTPRKAQDELAWDLLAAD